jgi:hypothetical protein
MKHDTEQIEMKDEGCFRPDLSLIHQRKLRVVNWLYQLKNFVRGFEFELTMNNLNDLLDKNDLDDLLEVWSNNLSRERKEIDERMNERLMNDLFDLRMMKKAIRMRENLSAPEQDYVQKTRKEPEKYLFTKEEIKMNQRTGCLLQ